ncbi:hypothetical protein ELH36_17755 [Rhizobium ruizarguesonis]|uniref:hypothetical protein n=1 Tax=Rhizobium ruizarguesonis TaxID=2081791 RepID=UPI001031AC58|nr:hypothetical protein [Rhizobium ruizarguesonis]TBC64447.1 hypothetical protein ELH36_17755 [Rhizobium ruizarguesonis]
MADKKKSIATTGMVPLGVSVAAEVLSSIGMPGGSLLASLVDAYQEKKRAEASELLIEEIAAGRHGPVNFDTDDVDPLIAVTLRFARAVEIGSSRENLKLLAQVIAGLKKNRALSGDAFMRWAGVLEQMTRDELVLIGIAYRAQKDYTVSHREGETGVWARIIQGLLDAGYTDGDISPLAGCVTRYGLLSLHSGFGGVSGYEPTSWLMELGELADLELVTTKND